ncbi:MAG: nucleotidyltransferase [Chitinophagaceae bacterium]|nr:MAG: nucleotidyltransferase [Chitinophagaceae bacterium]
MKPTLVIMAAGMASRYGSMKQIQQFGPSGETIMDYSIVKGPFAVINADDFYGEDAFVKANNFLVMECKPDLYGIVAYNLNNTLSEHGSVSRGVIDVSDDSRLLAVNERLKIYRENGQIVNEDGETKMPIAEDAKASMNFWCFHPSIFPYIREEFAKFLGEKLNDPKSEFLIPFVADQFIKSGRGQIKVLPTTAPWFGVTYKEDAPIVQRNLNNLIEAETYPNRLW